MVVVARVYRADVGGALPTLTGFMTATDPDTAELIHRAHGGDGTATEQLLARNRDRLRRMVLVHRRSTLSIHD